jgi:hypothetical protein
MSITKRLTIENVNLDDGREMMLSLTRCSRPDWRG